MIAMILDIIFQLIASAALYLAGKNAVDGPIKVRDVINVTYSVLERTLEPLSLNEEYWRRRDSIVQAELFLARMLKFNLAPVLPHKVSYHWCGVQTHSGLFSIHHNYSTCYIT